MANFKAVMRLFKKFTQSTNESVMDRLYRWMFGQLSINGITLDLDSTVMTRYGAQEGVERGYKPDQTRTCQPSSLDGLCRRYAHDCQLLAASG